MKISYRTHPILEKLHNGSLGKMPLYDEIDELYFKTPIKAINPNYIGDPTETCLEHFVKYWKLYSLNFKKEINVISKPFAQAAVNAKQKLTVIIDDVINDIIDFNINATFLIANKVIMIDYHVKKGSEDIEIEMFCFTKEGMPIMFYQDSSKHKLYQFGWVSNLFKVEYDCYDFSTKEKIELFLNETLSEATLYSMFKTYAEVETKICPPNKKTKDINCKYINDTKLELTFLDSKWFTNLVKSDAFKVRGHFRLQPCKNEIGEWTKKLIWISDFMKSGYTAPARKESNANEHQCNK